MRRQFADGMPASRDGGRALKNKKNPAGERDFGVLIWVNQRVGMSSVYPDFGLLVKFLDWGRYGQKR